MNNSNVENIFLSDLKLTQNVLKTKSSKLLNEYLLKKNSINEKEKITNEIEEIRKLKSNFLSEKFLKTLTINFSTTSKTSCCSTNDISKSN